MQRGPPKVTRRTNSIWSFFADSKVIQWKNILEKSDIYKNQWDFIEDTLNTVIDERKSEIEKKKTQ